jgi:predicted RND superfamily exporter protein
VLALAVFVVLALAPGLARLRIDVDGRALLPRDAPEVAVDRAVRERFDVRDAVAVVLERPGPNGVFETDAMEAVARITRALERLDGLGAGDVLSLANEPSDHVRPGSLEFRKWLEPMPATREQLDTLRGELIGAGIWNGTLLSNDSPPSATAVLVRVPEIADRGAWIASLQDAVREATGAEALFRVHVVGAPVAEALLGEHILTDLRLLLPIALVALSFVFALAFRNVIAVTLPALEVLVVLVCVFGAMGWSGSPVYLTSAVIPVILASVIVTDEIHVLAELRRRLAGREELDAASAVRATLERLAPAIDLPPVVVPVPMLVEPSLRLPAGAAGA